MLTRRMFVFVLLLGVFIFQAYFVRGANYYVAKTGNDANPGTEAAPWLTIQKAANTLSAGDTVYIKAGTYAEQVKPQTGGTSGNYITYSAYGDDVVTIDGTGISLSNYEGLFHIDSLNYIIVSGLRVVDAGPNDNNSGIYAEGCSYITVENCYTYNTVSSGIAAWSSSNITINNNEVELACNDGEQECITVAGVDTFEIKNNHVHDSGPGTNGGEGIDVKDGSHDGAIYNNRVHDLNQRLGIYIDSWDKHTYNIDVYNNIVYNIVNNDGFTLAAEMGGLLENINIYNNIAYSCDVNGISISQNGDGASHPMRQIHIINNTFYNNGVSWGGGIHSDNADAETVVVRNNICSQNLSFQIADEAGLSAANFVVDYNLIDGYRSYEGETYGTSYQIGSPNFVSTVTPDFNLQAGSPAIDNGTSTLAPATDYAGNSRPQGSGYDIGAYEYVSETPGITVTAPNGGESWDVGSSRDITWTSTGTVGDVKIEYSTNNGTSWSTETASTANDGSYTWTVPDQPSSQCLVRVSETDGDPADSSDAVFTIADTASSSITVTSPNGGESWDVGSSQAITWTSTGTVGDVKIEYSTNNGSAWTEIEASTDNDGSYGWTVPDTPSGNCLVRVGETDGDPVDGSDAVFTILSTAAPEIQLSRGQLNYGATGSYVTGSQSFLVSNAGGSVLNWTAACDQSWLSCTPASGSGDGLVTVSVDPTGLAAGTYSGSVSIADGNATNSPQAVSVNLTVYAAGTSSAPVGQFATPENNETVSSSIAVTGWVVDDIEVSSVKIYRDQDGQLAYIGDALLVDGARSDVEQAYPNHPMSYKAGWGYMMLTNFLPNGNGVFDIHALATDAEGNVTPLGVKTITVDNANAVNPFGAIDSPAAGGAASGASYRNNGWVLTPPPGTVPTDGSSIFVYVNGVNLGNPVYGVYRPDIETLFPGYNNSSGAAAYLDIDTTVYENGVHIIYWIATDDNGNADGIGSRFFSIQNTGADLEEKSNGAKPATFSGIPGGIDGLLKLPEDNRPTTVLKGWDEKNGGTIRLPDGVAAQKISLKEMERVRIHLGDFGDFGNKTERPGSPTLTLTDTYCGYLMVGEELRPLPIGSTLDAAKGIFYWQPGPGFLGQFELVFIRKESGDGVHKTYRYRKNITIQIR